MAAEIWLQDPSDGLNFKAKEWWLQDPADGLNFRNKEVWTQDPADGLNARVFAAGVGYTTQTWTESSDWASATSRINPDGSGVMGMQIGNKSTGWVKCYLRFIFDKPITLPVPELNHHFEIAAYGDRYGIGKDDGDKSVFVQEINNSYNDSLPSNNMVINYRFVFNRTPGPVSQVTLRVYAWGETISLGKWADFDFRWNSGDIKLFGHPITAPTGILPIQQ